ncbi:MAG: hypothetical protein QF819_05570 [Gemmatimonadota bacterium]|nr:hypothetical protein [Gemmatimonadota bacterium]MDP6529441.1 hypothetical protein [Gemmatimonadota bacterium]MDP6802631.1 hypothetical protein [Gemmatimonadota bacterium]MDP7030756.1 hypothetical protein [Gemmatimonadota bacterium]
MTIREILTKVETFHSEFGQRLADAKDTVEDGRAKVLIDFLSEHQQALADALSTMEKETPDHVATLDEWVQFDTDIEDPRTYLQGLRFQADATAEDVLEQANNLDVCLFCLYKGMARGSSTPKAQRLFARLARMELEHQKLKSQSYY